MKKDMATAGQKVEQLWQSMVQQVTNPDMWFGVILALIKIILIVIFAQVVVRIGSRLTDRLFRKRERHIITMDERRMNTISKLIKNVIKYTIYFAALLMVIGQLGYPLGPLLAGAGVFGLAVGFGAQSLVRDIITGFFIIFEDQFAVGDTISTGNYMGTVEEIGLRITRIQSWTGEVFIIPNGAITEVTNFSLNNSIAVVDVRVAYEEDINHVTQALNDIVQAHYTDLDNIVKQPEVLGVQSLGSSDVVLRVVAECRPMTHFAVARRLRAVIKTEFDKQGIEIPYPRLVTFQPKAQGE